MEKQKRREDLKMKEMASVFQKHAEDYYKNMGASLFFSSSLWRKRRNLHSVKWSRFKISISKQFLTFSTKTALLCKLLIRRSLRTCWIIPAYDYLYILPVCEDRRLHNLLIYLCDLVNVWLNWVQISKCDFPGQRLWRDNQWRC